MRRAGQAWALPVVLCMLVIACSPPGGFRLSHDYPAPPSLNQLRQPGACPGGEALAARSLVLPKYPFFARRQGRQGWVVAQLDVLPDGRTANVLVKQSAPPGVFDRSAIKAVRKWRFAPVGGKGLHACLVYIDYRLGHVRIGR